MRSDHVPNAVERLQDDIAAGTRGEGQNVLVAVDRIGRRGDGMRSGANLHDGNGLTVVSARRG